MQKTKQTIMIHLSLRIAIFLFFFLAIFLRLPHFLIYSLFLIIFTNTFFDFVNKKKNFLSISLTLMANLFFILISFILLFAIIEFFMAMIGVVISLIYLVVFYFKIFRGEQSDKNVNPVTEVPPQN